MRSTPRGRKAGGANGNFRIRRPRPFTEEHAERCDLGSALFGRARGLRDGSDVRARVREDAGDNANNLATMPKRGRGKDEASRKSVLAGAGPPMGRPSPPTSQHGRLLLGAVSAGSWGIKMEIKVLGTQARRPRRDLIDDDASGRRECE